MQPMLNDYIYKTPVDKLNLAEKVYRNTIADCFKQLTSDFKANENNTLLFPGKMSSKELLDLPPTVILTSEYDIFRKEAYDFADKLRIANRLLDFSDYADVTHNFAGYLLMTTPIQKQLVADYNTLLSKHLLH